MRHLRPGDWSPGRCRHRGRGPRVVTIYRSVELPYLLHDGFAGGRGLLHQRGVLLRHLIELHDRLVDLLDTGRLLAARAGARMEEAGQVPLT